MSNKAVFLDRDGVINIDHGYVHKIEEFDFMPGIFEFCQHAKRLGYKLILATNQSGIGRGYYSKNDFLKLADWMKAQFAENQCEIDGLYYSPYHPEKAQPPYLKKSDCRKPATLARDLASEHAVSAGQMTYERLTASHQQ